jgi:hypothetical protein
MEKLQRRSDGIAETPSGLFAISPKRSSGRDSETNWFDFKKRATSETIRVRWPRGETIAVIDSSIALFMLSAAYARNASDEEVRAWNAAIEELDLDAPDPAPVPIEDAPEPPEAIEEEKPEATEQPASAQTAPEATTTANGAQTAPEAQDLANSGTPEATGSTGGTAGEGTGTESGAGVTEGTDPADQEGTVAEETDDDKGSEGGTKPKGKKKETKGLL